MSASIAYYGGIVTDGLVLYLDAAKRDSYPGFGTSWRSVARGASFSGSLVNGPTFNSASGSIQFDGVNDYVITPRPPEITTQASISVSVWAKWVTIGSTESNIQVLIDNNHSSIPIQGFILQDRPDLGKKLTWSVYPTGNGVSSSYQVGDGAWKHITGTHQSGLSNLYINGVLDGFFNETRATVQPNISIGYWQFTPSRYINGNIAQVQIYNRALSAQEVLQNYNATKGRFNL